jgi:hypothetical protein
MTEDRAVRGESHRLAIAGLSLCAALIAGCASGPGEEARSPAGPAASASLPRERLVGNWGTASFHDAKDRKRTEAEARAQCRQPYAITKGPSDGVMMHVADDPKRYELKLKDGAGGKTYLGFDAPAGDPQDREVLSATETQLTMKFVDPDVHKRYGTFVYVRCGRQA